MKEQNRKFTRQDITDAARALLGVRFRHQGRDPKTGVDCVGLLVVLGSSVQYPHVRDLEGYRRVPSADTIRTMLRDTCDEIPVAEVGEGDIYLMRMGGAKPRHVGVRADRGDEPAMIHASWNGVRHQPLSDFPPSWFVAGFRLRGLAD